MVSAPNFETSAHPIIGGASCDAKSFSATGGIFTRYTFDGKRRGSVCTGTLIRSDVVLTAAHCTIMPEGATDIESFFSLAADIAPFLKNENPEHTYAIKSMIGHAGGGVSFEGVGDGKDIGLAFLAEPVKDIAPAQIADPTDATLLQSGTQVVIVGYGQRGMNTFDTTKKSVANATINLTSKNEMQIGSDENSSRKCHGDSGGPTFLNVGTPDAPEMLLVGVTSHAYDARDCAVGGVDTRVDAFYNWVMQSLYSACVEGTRVSCSADEMQAPVVIEASASPETIVEDGGCSASGNSSTGGFAMAIIALAFLRLRRR